MTTETAPTETELLPADAELPTKRADTLSIWQDFSAQAEKLKQTAETLTVTDVSQIAEMKLARATRLALKELRCSVESKRKELGEYHLKETQKINGAAKAIKDAIEPLELRLKEQEEFIERETLRIEDGKRASRHAEIAPFLTGPLSVDLGNIPDADYDKMLADAKDLHALREERARKEREEAEAKAKAEAEERERIRLENERLKKEAAEREAQAAAEREAAAKLAREEKAKADAEIARVKAEAEATAKAEREKAEAEARSAAEKARLEREAIEAKAKAERLAAEKKAKAEREAREKLEAEIAEKKAAEEKAEAERKATEKAAAMAPEKEKLKALAKTVRELHIPVLESEEGIAAVVEINAQVEKFAAYIVKKAESLG